MRLFKNSNEIKYSLMSFWGKVLISFFYLIMATILFQNVSKIGNQVVSQQLYDSTLTRLDVDIRKDINMSIAIVFSGQSCINILERLKKDDPETWKGIGEDGPASDPGDTLIDSLI